MNERITELANLCYEYDEVVLGTWFNKTKFAKLIINECIKVNNQSKLTIDNKVDLEDDYREYFGIE